MYLHCCRGAALRRWKKIPPAAGTVPRVPNLLETPTFRNRNSGGAVRGWIGIRLAVDFSESDRNRIDSRRADPLTRGGARILVTTGSTGLPLRPTGPDRE